MQAQLSVTITGANLNALIEGATKFINANSGTGNAKTEVATKAPAPKVAAKKAAAPVAQDDETDLLSEDDESNDLGDLGADTSEDELNFDSSDDGAEELEEQPKAKKATKVTVNDVNAAAMAHAKKHKKINTLALLQKKFKVKSIMELKPDQYAAAITALKA